VEADGHCLYRAVAAQTNREYQEIRKYSTTVVMHVFCSTVLAYYSCFVLAQNNTQRFLICLFFIFYFCCCIMYFPGALCADTLQANQDELAPFCEYTEDVASFDAYVDRVRSSAEWGGHLELRTLGMALDLPILVYSLQSGSKPLAIHDDDERNDDDGGKNNKTPIRLSYHLHYYALGEHYNQVVET
jgi:hypothetical protein